MLECILKGINRCYNMSNAFKFNVIEIYFI